MAEAENYVEVREEYSIYLNFVNSGSSRKKKGKGNLMYIFISNKVKDNCIFASSMSTNVDKIVQN